MHYRVFRTHIHAHVVRTQRRMMKMAYLQIHAKCFDIVALRAPPPALILFSWPCCLRISVYLLILRIYMCVCADKARMKFSLTKPVFSRCRNAIYNISLHDLTEISDQVSFHDAFLCQF